MIPTSDFKNGKKIEMDGIPYEILEHQHHKPGKGGAVMRTKLRNLLNGRVIDHTFRSGEKVAKPNLETREMQYLYREGKDFAFMDMTSYEQLTITAEQAGSAGGFLVESEVVKVLLYNENPLTIDLPASVVMEIAETEPGVRGDTVSGATKPATLSSGIVVQVPLFVEQGEKIKVDTRSGNYIGREK
ncbi:elongation factor P [Desulfovibrio ferrophilus]|uniref:Elongation factor P n=1 Tax=Desulfovibrio ferrophilus TaxID=241368 RepID=A0A2Z6AWU1_9BACT|nr:elongation factor P [Desulfovibrio ferrophilus]BBD07701.1 elongation factor P [Desulfovibrio ferrophilus]